MQLEVTFIPLLSDKLYNREVTSDNSLSETQNTNFLTVKGFCHPKNISSCLLQSQYKMFKNKKEKSAICLLACPHVALKQGKQDLDQISETAAMQCTSK